ncbi:MupG family TIM beta-alpha barrel fold protein [Candidatus Epulonipiscium viviparus]|uniref:MupG family TIM beta-alpha barrel fold protein n=1 Tax=Candidatus Epulonipiscium viviparus TaxID=420336 RepID=UPI0027380D13|nr:MupG family TIM beta-alpha barrel fold protein [Candidatus Epulopiscium viviparus]
MKMGYSVYVSTFEQQKTFLEKVAAKIIFTSLHIPEEIGESYKKDALNMLAWLKEREFCVIADISTHTLKQFNSSSIIELAKRLNIGMLRIDYGFSVDEIVTAASAYPLVFNASTVDIATAKLIQANVGNIKAIHNFYPHAYTALSTARFDQINTALQSQQIEVFGFVPNIESPRGPIYEGLPTLEHQRKTSPYVNAIEIWTKVNYLLLGDLAMDDQELEWIKKLEKDNVITIPAAIEYEYLYNRVFTIRIDSSEYVLRLQESRDREIKEHNCVAREVGDITCDNIKYLRYSGEVQIIKVRLPQDDRVNVIGKIATKYKNICNFISNGSKIEFVKYI